MKPGKRHRSNSRQKRRARKGTSLTKLPYHFKTAKGRWKIKYVAGPLYSDDHVPLLGCTDSTTRTIHVTLDQPKDQVFHTLMHEWTHAVICDAGLHNDGWVSTLVEEILCDNIAWGIAHFYARK